MDRPTSLWPFGQRAAVMAVPTILIVVLAIVAILQLSMRWPGSQSESFILGGALLLSLLPVGLRVIDMTVMRGGSIAYGSLKLDFASTVRQDSDQHRGSGYSDSG